MIADRLERSMLFVPAARRPMIEKAVAVAADAVCLDLEDSVPLEEKPAARNTAIRALQELDFGDRTRILRINGLDTPFAYRDLIEVVEAAGDRIDLIMLPKAGSREDVAFVDRLLSQIEMHREFGRPIGIEAQIETASGFMAVAEIAQASPRLEALIFGPGDYSASMQMPSEFIGEVDARWQPAMHAIVAAARASGLRCVDGPYAAYKDTEGFDHACRIARSMGFDGKQCIHPGQLLTANRVFTPAREEAAKAEEIVKAYEEAAAQGRGSASFNGRMIDAANLRMARVILRKYQLSRSREAGG